MGRADTEKDECQCAHISSYGAGSIPVGGLRRCRTTDLRAGGLPSLTGYAARPATFTAADDGQNGGKLVDGKPLPLEKGVEGRIGWLFAVRRETKQPTDLRTEHDRVQGAHPERDAPDRRPGGLADLLARHPRQEGGRLRVEGKEKPKAVSPSFESFLEASLAGKLGASKPAKPARPLTRRDFIEFINGHLDALRPTFLDDLKKRIFKMKLVKGAKSLDFEVFDMGLDRELPIVGYQMNDGGQLGTNVAVLSDKTCIIPARLFEPFRNIELDDEEALTTELVMTWFIKGWRAAGGQVMVV